MALEFLPNDPMTADYRVQEVQDEIERTIQAGVRTRELSDLQSHAQQLREHCDRARASWQDENARRERLYHEHQARENQLTVSQVRTPWPPHG